MENIECIEKGSVRKKWIIAFLLALIVLISSTIAFELLFPLAIEFEPLHFSAKAIGFLIGSLPFLGLYVFAYRKKGTRFLHVFLVISLMFLMLEPFLLLAQYQQSMDLNSWYTISLIIRLLTKIYLLYYSYHLWKENRAFQIEQGRPVPQRAPILKIWSIFLVVSYISFILGLIILDLPGNEAFSQAASVMSVFFMNPLLLYWLIMRSGIQRKSVLLSVYLIISTLLVVFIWMFILVGYFQSHAIPTSIWISQSILLVTGIGFFITSAKLLVDNIRYRISNKKLKFD